MNRRTFDARELKWPVRAMRADLVRTGDEICHSRPGFNYVVEAVERCEIGVRLRFGDGLQTECFADQDLVYVLKAK